MIIRFEFSEQQQAFHSNYDKPSGTNGYTLLGEIDNDLSAKFVDMMNRKYNRSNVRLSLELVSHEFNRFVEPKTTYVE